MSDIDRNHRIKQTLKAVCRAVCQQPNKIEQFLDKFLNKILPNEYKFVGDGEFILGGRCPDYLNVNGKKKVIELFGDYWHSKNMTGCSKKKHEQERINYFKKFGFDCLVIWENELNNKNKINKIKDKIICFNNT